MCSLPGQTDSITIHEYARHGDLPALRERLRDDPACRDATDDDGMAPLHWAVARGQTAAVAELLCHDADPDLPLALNRRTPLHMAALKGQADIVELLLAAGANVFAEDVQGEWPLHKAPPGPVVSLLREPTLLPFTRVQSAVREGAEMRLERLLAARPDLLRATDDEGRTAAHLAVRGAQPRILVCLLKAGAPCDARDSRMATPLHLAAGAGNASLVACLLNHGARTAERDGESLTPLHLAAACGREIGWGAEVATRTGVQVSDDAAPVLVQMSFDLGLVEPADDVPATPPVGDHLAVIRLLLEQDADVNAQARGGLTPLHLAARYGNLTMVACLLDHGARVEAATIFGATPLQDAAAFDQREIIDLLIAAGANPALTVHIPNPRHGDAEMGNPVGVSGILSPDNPLSTVDERPAQYENLTFDF